MKQSVAHLIYPIGTTLLLPDASQDGKMCTATVIHHTPNAVVAQFKESEEQVTLTVDVQKLKYYEDDAA